ncbi:MAG: sensor histidine kinase [Oscillospiraceae bacterium]
MRKSVFSEFFTLCAAIISAAVVCAAVVLIVISSEFYKNDKKSFLVTNADSVMTATKLAIDSAGGVSTDYLKNMYLNVTDTTEIVFTLTDSNGVALVCSEAPPCSHTGRNIGEETLNKVDEDGFFELSTLDHFYPSTVFNLVYKFESAGNEYYLFSKLSDTPLQQYLTKLIITLAIVSVIVLALVFVAIYTAVKHLMTPVKDMTLAAKRFGDGDFSEKLYVPEDNEFGFLANSLNEMASSLEAIEENRKSFISNVSHELRTPMTTIGGFVDGILDGTIPAEKHNYYLRIVSEEIDRLARLVRSMLNISKYEAGEMEMTKEVFDLMPILVKTVLMFEKRIDDKHVEIRGIDRGMFMVNADADLIQQVIYNLVENAVKFVNDGGYIEFAFESKDDTSIIRIRNSGEGLKANEISKVFDRFYKADASRGIDKTGVGLGLSIVRSIIKLHEGKILVRSEPDSFVEFEIRI